MADRVTETTTIAAPPEVIREVLLDFARYPEWATDLKSVEVLDQDDEGQAREVRFRAAGMGRSTSYTLRYDLSDPAVVAWRLTDGDLTRKLDGQYALVPADGGTRVEYELEVELIVPLPGFIKRRTQGKIMHTALGELKARVEGSNP
ncbi:MAG: cyclase/dehydrase [Acidimicrobiales bacterium]|nr:cyclase/dehydrase [Acidimicrobiales bacterium]